MQISKNFKLAELLESNTALQWGFKEQFEPPEEVVESLIDITINILQPLRDLLKIPIRISSGYRCPRVNSKVGGATTRINGKMVQTSQHTMGQAVDIKVIVNGEKANYLIIEALKELSKNPKFEFDQVIKEYGSERNPSWIHISFRKNKNRNQILRKDSGTGYITIKL